MRLTSVLFGAVALAAVPAGAAGAAPQILALLSTDAPVALACTGGQCSAELTAFCLQEKRARPDKGTRYAPGPGTRIVLRLIRADGTVARLPARRLASFVSVRGEYAVRVSIPKAALKRFGAVKAEIAVGRLASLVPVPLAGDASPITKAEVDEVTGPMRETADAVTRGERRIDTQTARILGRLIRGREKPGARGQRLWARAVGTKHAAASHPQAVAAARDRYRLCRSMDRVSACLRMFHDRHMWRVNTKYWEKVGEAGS